MLHVRLRPLPRRHPTTTESISTAAPTFQDEDDDTETDEPEDLLSAFLPHLSPDDAPPFHGDPGQHLFYSSPRYGDLEIMVPAYPEKRTEETRPNLEKGDRVNEVEEGRKLFAHLLWSAAMVVAEGVEDADLHAHADTRAQTSSETDAQKERREMWSVKGESVLELGAGAALPSLICALANASTVVATDHPSSPALSGAIAFNMNHNLANRSPPPGTATQPQTKVSIHPLEWGALTDSFAQQHKGAFTRIIAADCLWMRSQHENLARTMQWFLAPGGKVWVVAGLHTGRAIVAGFFETVLACGFEIEMIFERDLVYQGRTGDGDGDGVREWESVREGEGPENWRRWCVVAVLKKRE